MRRGTDGILVVSVLALVATGYLLFTWVSFFFASLDAQRGAGGFDPNGTASCATITAVPLCLLAGIFALVHASVTRRRAWQVALLMAIVIGVAGLVIALLNPYVYNEVDSFCTNDCLRQTFPPPLVNFAIWLPIVVPLAALTYHAWSARRGHTPKSPTPRVTSHITNQP
jgi:hypothetical protein